jgi:hypothetical protein
MVRKSLLSLGLGLIAIAQAHAAPSVTLTASPASSMAPATITVTWSSTDVASCVASGAWDGPKALSGTQVFANVQNTRTYTLTCQAASGSTLASWEEPTTYEDDTPFPPGEPAKYEIWHHTTSAVESGVKVEVAAPATSALIEGLPAGLRYFGAKTVTTENVASVLSNIAETTIVLPSATASATAIVLRRPKPPRAFGVSQ